MEGLFTPAGRLRAALLACCLLGAGGQPSPAQLPAGGIAGEIRDPSGAAVSGARVLARNIATGLERSATGDERGASALSLLPPGVYGLSVEAQGFHDPRKRVVVQTGATMFVDVERAVAVLEQVVESLDSLPELRYDWQGVDGVVSRFQIENLPLNGRESFQLAILEPGVTAAPRADFFTR